MHKPVTIVILAAGLGTRMKSRQAKVLHKAGGKTLLQHVLDSALALASPPAQPVAGTSIVNRLAGLGLIVALVAAVTVFLPLILK